MSEQVDKLKQALRTTQKISAADFRAMQQKAAISYAKHFPDPLQAATDDVLGQCLEVMRDVVSTVDSVSDPNDAYNRARRILAMTGGGK